jgi:dipeptidyl-peptidase-3
MKKIIVAVTTLAMITACNNEPKQEEVASQEEEKFEWQVDQFEDIRVLRYQVPGWDKLSASQRMLVYHLGQAGLSGRDIMWDMNYRHNLRIRKALENIIKNYEGDKNEARLARFYDLCQARIFCQRYSSSLQQCQDDARV